MKTTLLFIFLLVSVFTCAQDQRLVDSLQAELKNFNAKKLELGNSAPAMFDTTAAKILYELSKTNWYGKPDKAIEFAIRSKEISENIGYKKGVGFAIYSIGVGFAWKANFPMAIEYTKSALQYGQAISDKQLVASAYTNLGIVNSLKSNYSEALKNNFAAIKLAEEIDDKQILIWNYGNITYIYNILEKYDDALKYCFVGLELAKKMGDNSAVAELYTTIGVTYTELGKYSEAMSYHLKALEIRRYLKDDFAMVAIYNNLGYTHERQENYAEALRYYFQCLNISEDLNDKAGIGFAYDAIGVVYYKQKRYVDAIEYLNKGLKIAKEISNLSEMKTGYKTLSDIYNEMAASPSTPALKKGDYAVKALDYYKHFITYRDSIVNIENAKKITQQQMQFDFDKKEAATKAEQDKKHALANAEIQKQKIVRNFSFAGIFIVLLIGSYGFYRFRKNKKLENQQSLLNERLRISRELHDDMGSTLSSISVYSEVAKNRASKNENETEVLQKIGTASRELIDKMSDIVWSLNPNNENFDQLKNRMMAFAAMMLTPKGIQYEFEIDEEVKSTAITPEQRKNIFLIYKEAINNIVKYSEATSVKVKVKVKENKLSLEILDNGKGFDTSNVVAYNGNGLKNMRARAEEIKALFNVTSSINEGTGIELSFNL